MGSGLTLWDVCEELVDCVNRTAPETPDGDFFAVGTPAMRGNVIDLSQARRISAETFTKWTRRLVPQEGDLLLAREAPVGPVVRIPSDGKIAAGQRTIHLRADPSVVHPRYLFYLLTSPSVQAQLLALAMGSTVPHLRVADVKSFTLPALPPLVQQEAIQETLGALDDKIAINERLHSLADHLCAAEVQRASVSGVRRQLRDVLTLHYGKALPASARTPGNVVVYGSGGITGTHFHSLVDRAGVVVGRKGTVGAVYWASGPHFPIDTTYYVEPHEVGTDEILYYLLRSARLAELNSDSAVPGLNRDEAYACQVTFPESHSIGALSRTLRQRFGWMKTVREEMKTLAATRDELAPLLLSGKIRVREAERSWRGLCDGTAAGVQ